MSFDFINSNSSSSSSSSNNDNEYFENDGKTLVKVIIQKKQGTISDNYKNLISIVNDALFPRPQSSYCLNRLGYNNSRNNKYLGKLSEKFIITIDQYDQITPIYLKKYTGNAKFVTIYFHGNGEDLGDCVIKSNWISDSLNSHVFFAEYPGYGITNNDRNSQKATEFTVMERARFVIEYIRQAYKVPYNRMLLYGYSIGSAVTVQLFYEYCYGKTLGMYERTKDYKFAGIILQSGFSSFKNVAKNFSSFSFLSVERFDSVSRLEEIQKYIRSSSKNKDSTPLFFYHGAKDDVVPISHSEKMFQVWYGRSHEEERNNCGVYKMRMMIDQEANHIVFSKSISESFVGHIVKNEVIKNIEENLTNISKEKTELQKIDNLKSKENKFIEQNLEERISSTITKKKENGKSSSNAKKYSSVIKDENNGEFYISLSPFQIIINDINRIFACIKKSLKIDSLKNKNRLNTLCNRLDEYFNVSSRDVSVFINIVNMLKKSNSKRNSTVLDYLKQNISLEFNKTLNFVYSRSVLECKEIRRIRYFEPIWVGENYDNEWFTQYLLNKKK